MNCRCTLMLLLTCSFGCGNQQQHDPLPDFDSQQALVDDELGKMLREERSCNAIDYFGRGSDVWSTEEYPSFDRDAVLPLCEEMESHGVTMSVCADGNGGFKSLIAHLRPAGSNLTITDLVEHQQEFFRGEILIRAGNEYAELDFLPPDVVHALYGSEPE